MMDNITNTNKKKKKVSYWLSRLFIIYLGLPIVGMFYYGLSKPLFSLLMNPNADGLSAVYEVIAKTLSSILFIPIFAFFYLFTQLLVYTIIMGIIVLPWVKNKYGVMILSGVMCALFPLISMTGDFSLSNLYSAGINLCLAGFISGIFIGYLLYCSYRKQLEKNQ